MTSLRSVAIVGAMLVVGAAATAQSQSPATTDSSVGVLIVAHGADAEWNARVDSLAAEVRRGGAVRGPVAVSFLMGPAAEVRRFQNEIAALQRAGARRVVVVPMLVSSHSGHYDQIRYLVGELKQLDDEMQHHLQMSGIERVTNVPMVVTRALDDAPEMATVLAARAKTLSPAPAGRALFLFGHGPNSAEDYATWMSNLRTVADSVKTITGFASVAVELVRDDAPPEVRGEAVKRAREIIGLQRAATGHDVVVVPILVSSGDVSRRKLPADLAGTPIVYSGEPLLPDAQLARWVERRVIAATRAWVTGTVR